MKALRYISAAIRYWTWVRKNEYWRGTEYF